MLWEEKTQPDGSVITYSYSGNTTTITDEAGKVRRNVTDGLGRLTSVIEDPNGVNYETDYTYDCLSNLTSVNQKGSAPGDSSQWHTRTSAYDSLSRLTSANNPESGHTGYTYDNDGAVISRVDNAGQTTQYTVDALHRVTKKHYLNTYYGDADILYCYDNVQTSCGTASVSNGIGRRTGMADASGKTGWSYDVMGRVLQEAKTISGVSKSLSYSYNVDGSLSMLTLPSGDQSNVLINS